MSSLAASSGPKDQKSVKGRSTRRLAAILLMDVAGYSSLVSRDEAGTLAALKGHLNELIRPQIAFHEGRVVKTTGDGLLADFASAVQAVLCGLKIQSEMVDRNQGTPEDRQIQFRIGINLGEVVFEDDDVFGDGVNIAARLQTLAEPNGICLADDVYRHVKGKVPADFQYLGFRSLKGVRERLRVFRAVPTSDKSRERQAQPAEITRSLSPVPWVAVLPFENLSGDPEQSYFSDGITNDLITDLSKFPDLGVVASHSVFTYKNRPTKIEQVAQELGVRYVVEGSVQRSGDSVRINVQLVDAASEIHLWSERFKRPLKDLFNIYDEIINRLVASLVARVEMSERERALSKPTESLEAYDHCLRGRELWYCWEKEANQRAQAHFRQAISLDPAFAQAYRNLSYVLIQSCLSGWLNEPATAIAEARTLAERAVALGPADYENYGQLGFASLYRRDFHRSLASYEKALELNPNSADLLAEMADALTHMGRTKEGLAMVARAKALNPFYPDWYDWILGIAELHDGRYEEALSALSRVGNSCNFLRCDLIATYMRLDRLGEARTIVRAILEEQPTYRLATETLRPFKDKDVLQRFVTDLRLAGLPD